MLKIGDRVKAEGTIGYALFFEATKETGATGTIGTHPINGRRIINWDSGGWSFPEDVSHQVGAFPRCCLLCGEMYHGETCLGWGYRKTTCKD